MPDETVRTDLQQSLDQQTPADQPPAQSEYVSKTDHEKVLAEVASLKESLTGAGEKLAILDRVAEMLVGKSAESPLSKEEQLVVAELRKLMPHVVPNIKFLDQAPQLAQTIQQATKTATESLTQAAYGYQLELQADAGLDTKDAKFNYLLGNSIKEWINQSPDRRARFWRGDRTVIEEGFKEVKPYFAPAQRAERREMAQTLQTRPKNSAPAGAGAPNGEGRGAPDMSDRKSVRAAIMAAIG